MKILLADDEENIKVLVEVLVIKRGYEFCYADNGEDALNLYEQEQPDLVILDVMMPKLNGFEVCRLLRKANCHAPIIFLSAKGDISDKSSGFLSGADDYLVKPFSSQELMLRIEALLRRRERESRYHSLHDNENTYKVGELEINFKRHEVIVRGKPVDLTPKEFKLLAYIVAHPGEVFSKEQLQEHVWGSHYIGEIAGIAVLIRRLREKIELDSSQPVYIVTVWGIGYKFSDK